MARTYAAILGMLAWGFILIRAGVRGWDLDESMGVALLACFVFALVGFLAGAIGEMLVNDSVRRQIQDAMSTWDPQKNTTPKRDA